MFYAPYLKSIVKQKNAKFGHAQTTDKCEARPCAANANNCEVRPCAKTKQANAKFGHAQKTKNAKFGRGPPSPPHRIVFALSLIAVLSLHVRLVFAFSILVVLSLQS